MIQTDYLRQNMECTGKSYTFLSLRALTVFAAEDGSDLDRMISRSDAQFSAGIPVTVRGQSLNFVSHTLNINHTPDGGLSTAAREFPVQNDANPVARDQHLAHLDHSHGCTTYPQNDGDRNW